MHQAHVRFVDSAKSNFFSVLRSRVDDYFKNKNITKYGNATMVTKTIVLALCYLGSFALIISLPMPSVLYYTLWSVMGFGLAGIGMSVMHDANHGSYSSNPKLNTLLGYSINLIGGSVFNWKLQHNVRHHAYTNIANYDDDINDKLVIRLSPHTEVKWFHRYQQYYSFVFYGMLTIYWTFMKDFYQFYEYIAKGVNKNSFTENAIILGRIILAKLFYGFFFIFAPIYFLHIPTDLFFKGYFLMHFIAGFVLTITFQLAHTVEHTTHPTPNEAGVIDNNWAIHQLNTTVDFSPNNKFLTWYMGGLNFQVEHHLFPNICHVHYPAIAKIVESTAKEYEVPYLINKTLFQAVASHYRLLEELGMPKKA
jgi:linoleoyl-CoA desaturase